MLKNYIKISLRNFRNDKLYSTVNMLGLSLGITVFLLTAMYTYYEFNYENKINNVNNKYRLVTIQKDSQNNIYQSWKVSDLLKIKIPEIINNVRIDDPSWEKNLFRYKDKIFREIKYYRADKSFFQIFDYKFIAGSPETALEQPNSIVITQRIAHKYFGKENPLGKFLETDKGQSYLVTGVCENIPETTHLKFDMISSLSDFLREDQKYWDMWNYYTYLQISSKTNKEEVERKINSELNKIPQLKDSKYLLQPLSEIHLKSASKYNIIDDIEKNGNINDIFLYISFGVIVLIVACVNYINLSIARFDNRIKEIGIRKTIGAKQKQIVIQFFIESIINALGSLIFALLLIKFFWSEFNLIIERNILITSENFINFSLVVFATLLITVLLAGVFPAIYFSKFSPGKILRGETQKNAGINIFRRGLIVFQFSISIIFLIVLNTIDKQNNYIFSKEIGVEKSNILAIPFEFNKNQQMLALKNVFQKLPNIETVSLGSSLPSEPKAFYNIKTNASNKIFKVHVIEADEDYLGLFKMNIISGRDFNTYTKGKVELIVNESAVKMFGWKNPVGEKLNLHGKDNLIVGVVKDFHFNSLHEKISPLVLSNCNFNSKLYLRVTGNNIESVIKNIKKEWNKFFPNNLFEYFLLTDDYSKMYSKEINTQKALKYLTLVALLISIIGLVSITSFLVSKRKKEFIIRKILGATYISIIKQMNREFGFLIIIANLFAWIPAYILINSWLENFAYRVVINIYEFILIGVILLILSFFIVSILTGKFLVKNPVTILKHD